MANWLTNIFNRGSITSLDLKRDENYGSSRVLTPKIPVLDTSYDSLLRYTRRSELVYACVEKKAQAACDAELFVERKNSEGEWEREKSMHPLITLLNKPNPYDDGESFRRSWIASEAFADTFYCEIVKSRAGVPVGLYPLHPAYIRPEYRSIGQAGWVLDHYVYTVDGYEQKFKPEELLIRRRHSIGSIYSNLSAMNIALGSVDADTALTDYIRAFFNNGATPSGVLSMGGRNLTQAEADAVQQQWMNKYSRGGLNRGGPAILPEGTTYTPVGAQLNTLDSDSVTSKIESRICMAFGVPPILVGAYVGLLHVNQRASVREAQQDFWMNTMSPELKSIRSFLTWNLLPMFEDIEAIRAGELRLNWDMSQVEALQDDLDDIHDRAGGGYKNGIYTLNEARDVVGLPPVEGEEGDGFYKPAPALGMMEEETPPPKRLKAADILDAPVIEPLEKKTFDYEGLTLSREPTLLELASGLKAIADSYDSGATALTKVIMDLRGELIQQAAKAVKRTDDLNIHTLYLSPPANAYKRVRKPIEASVLQGHIQVAEAEARNKGSDIVNIKSLQVDEVKAGIIDNIIQRLVDLTVSRVVNEVSTASVNIVASFGITGYDREDIEELLTEELESRSDAPFEGIARQATNSAVNAGRREEMKAREDEIKVYVYSAILDASTCSSCAEWDGKMSENLEDLPETPNNDCDGMANCRCFVITVYEGDTFEMEGNEVR